nr:hypothetical protein [Desulfurococcales archaeon]
KALEDMVYIKKHGILPVALRSPSKCNKCAFRDPCYSIDEELTEEHREALYEVGSWLQEEKRSISGRGPG